MSLEIPQETLDQVYRTMADERVQDLTLVAATTVAAHREGRSLDDHFVEELAKDRIDQAVEHYDYPVPGTMPTLRSSLRIVRDLMTIRELEATREERLAGLDLRGTGDIALSAAIGRERSDRLWEKGVLRIYDQHQSRSMWSAEFDQQVYGISREHIDDLAEQLAQKATELGDPYGRRS